MPRQPRLCVPGVIHHVMGRGIEQTKIFRDDFDRDDFLSRLASLAGREQVSVYAFALMPNHFHLLIRPLLTPLPTFDESGKA